MIDGKKLQAQSCPVFRGANDRAGGQPVKIVDLGDAMMAASPRPRRFWHAWLMWSMRL